MTFTSGLNCIIGARGTCKSTLVESIRFAFNRDESRIRTLLGTDDRKGQPQFNLIRATLGAGTVRCELSIHGEPEGTTTQVLEREVDGSLRLFQDGVREHTDTDVTHFIEIFSQGDLQRIAEDGNDALRIALVDRAHAIRANQLLAERSTHEDALSRLGPDLRNLRIQIANLQREVSSMPALREQLKAAESAAPRLSPELANERDLYERRRRVAETLREAVGVRAEVVPVRDRTAPMTARIAALRDRLAVEDRIDVKEEVAALEVLGARLQDASKALNLVLECDVERVASAAEARFAEENAKFFHLRQEQAAVNESLKQQQHLQRQLEALHRRVDELTSANDNAQRLLADRKVARARIAEIDNELYDLRIAEITRINSAHGDTVHLTLRTGAGGGAEYLSVLSSILAGSRLRNQDEVATEIVRTFEPSALVDIVEQGTGDRLASVLNREVAQMNRLVAHLGDHADLYRLESVPPLTKLDITLYDDGTPKPVETLSKGQKATALLPLILRPLPYPLIIDQPEDDLDNSFIYTSLVRTVAKLKIERQLIFVTHNANLPVLGGADNVVVMTMATPTRAAQPRIGAVDERKQDILDLLEGGAQAFALREHQYRDLLPE